MVFTYNPPMRYCSECKKEKIESYCQFCRKDTGNSYIMRVFTGIIKLQFPAIRMTHKRPGVKKFLRKVLTGFKPSIDIIKHPDGVNIHMVVDIKNDKYEKIVTDIKTGIVVRCVQEPLSQHIPSRQKRYSLNSIYFVRHGESEANLQGLFAGQKDDSILTEKGREQAKITAQNIKIQIPKIDRIICSPLKRTL